MVRLVYFAGRRFLWILHTDRAANRSFQETPRALTDLAGERSSFAG
jgi:hypothetical protein